jgi:hypothetical protein
MKGKEPVIHKERSQQTISPDPIFQMLTGFWVSKALITAEIDFY